MLAATKKCLIFSIHCTKSKYCNDSNKLVIGKMKGESCAVAIKEFVLLKRKRFLFLRDDNSEHKKCNKREKKRC